MCISQKSDCVCRSNIVFPLPTSGVPREKKEGEMTEEILS